MKEAEKRVKKSFVILLFILFTSGIFGTAEAETIWAGGSEPGVVYRYTGGTSWETVSPELGGAVLCFCDYNGNLYAGTIGSDSGKVWRYNGDDNWILVGDNLDNEVCSLIIFRGELYAGTAQGSGRLYRYDGGTIWTMVVDHEPWDGFRCMCVWNDILYIGDINRDRLGHYDGNSFTADADFGRSCTWDYEVYNNNLYVSAFFGMIYRSSNGTDWTAIRGSQNVNSWELEVFQDYLYVTTGPKLERYDESVFDLIWTEPSGYEIISMISIEDTLIFGVGKEAGAESGSGAPGTGKGRVYIYDGTTVQAISNDMGRGIQSLCKYTGIHLNKTDDINDGGCVAPGDEINYRIDYKYPDGVNLPDITDVNIIDYLPDEADFHWADSGGVYDPYSHTVTWGIGTLSPGDSDYVMLKVNVKQCIEPCFIIENECEIKNNNGRLGKTYEKSNVCCPTLKKTADDICCDVPNDNITYSICYDANGYRDTNVVITDSLPSEVNFVWASNGGEYNEGSRTVTWDNIDFPADACGCFELVVQYKPTDEPNWIIINCCVMSGDCMGNIFTACEDVYKCKASNPMPADGAMEVPIDAVLGWVNGALSEERDIYLGTSYSDVAEANRSNPLGVLLIAGQSPNSLDPYDVNGFLKLDQSYYWRVDEVNVPAGPVWRGDVWSFTTADNYLAEDFEEYGEGEHAITERWEDYLLNGTSADVYLESSPAHDEQSMRLKFWNYTFYPHYSEATFDITQAGVDMDTKFVDFGVKSLSIWFYGEAGNTGTEQMYLALSDGVDTAKVNYGGEMNDVQEEEWHEWNIALSEFAAANDINLNNIEEIIIGFAEGLPADGNVYFDDIRFYATRCALEKRSSDFARIDYAPAGNPAGDCIINFQEFREMAHYWKTASPPADTVIDLHSDGMIDMQDLIILCDMWLEEEKWPFE